MSQWVRHRSGEGEKWEVTDNFADFWEVRRDVTPTTWICLRLPKSEYKICEPPVTWRDVTSECSVKDALCTNDAGRLSILHEYKPNHLTDIFHQSQKHGYRLRKLVIPQFEPCRDDEDLKPSPVRCAFVIEKREP